MSAGCRKSGTNAIAPVPAALTETRPPALEALVGLRALEASVAG
jgi:hypothetical protein